MTHLLIDLAKIGLVIVCAAIFVAATWGTFGDPYGEDSLYASLDDEDDVL